MMLDRTQHRLTVAEYMSLDIKTKTELIDGIIYDMSPRNNAHRFALNVLAHALQVALPQHVVQQQEAVFLDGWHGKNAPEPDIAILRQAIGKPTTIDVLGLIEISDTTYVHDLKKVELYTAAGLPAWIVNIQSRWIEAYIHGYKSIYAFDTEIAILGVVIAVDSLFEITDQP